jgi:hypothetical protein
MPKRSHGETQLVDGKRVASAEYRSWQMMKNRCLNPNAQDYAYYGAKGVRVCRRWAHSFESFLADMGRRPSPAHTLERVDGSANYSPRNCCWATRESQARNRAYATTRQWELAEKLGVSVATARHYLWVVRRKSRGDPTRYSISPASEACIRAHMGGAL